MKLQVVGSCLEGGSISIEAEPTETFSSIFARIEEVVQNGPLWHLYDLVPSVVSASSDNATRAITSLDTLGSLGIDTNRLTPVVLTLHSKDKQLNMPLTGNASPQALADADSSLAVMTPRTCEPPSSSAAASFPIPATSSVTNSTSTNAGKWSFRDRLTAMYAKYEPAKLRVVEGTLRKFGGREEAVMKQLVKKYGPEPDLGEQDDPSGGGVDYLLLSTSPTTTAATSTSLPLVTSTTSAAASGVASNVSPTSAEAPLLSTRNYRDRLFAMYTTYDPAKLSTVDGTLRRFEGREESALRQLVQRYGPEPTSSPVTHGIGSSESGGAVCPPSTSSSPSAPQQEQNPLLHPFPVSLYATVSEGEGGKGKYEEEKERKVLMSSVRSQSTHAADTRLHRLAQRCLTEMAAKADTEVLRRYTRMWLSWRDARVAQSLLVKATVNVSTETPLWRAVRTGNVKSAAAAAAAAGTSTEFEMVDDVLPPYRVPNLIQHVANQHGSSNGIVKGFSDPVQRGLRALISALCKCIESGGVIQVSTPHDATMVKDFLAVWGSEGDTRSSSRMCPVEDSEHLARALHQAAHFLGELGSLMAATKAQTRQVMDLRRANETLRQQVAESAPYAEQYDTIAAELHDALQQLQEQKVLGERRRREEEYTPVTLSANTPRRNLRLPVRHDGLSPATQEEAKVASARKDALLSSLHQELAAARTAANKAKDECRQLRRQVEEGNAAYAKLERELKHNSKRPAPSGTPRTTSATSSAPLRSHAASPRGRPGYRTMVSTTPRTASASARNGREEGVMVMRPAMFSAGGYALEGHGTPRAISREPPVHHSPPPVSVSAPASARSRHITGVNISPRGGNYRDTRAVTTSSPPRAGIFPIFTSTAAVASIAARADMKKKTPCPHCLTPLAMYIPSDVRLKGEGAAFCFSCRRSFTIAELDR